MKKPRKAPTPEQKAAAAARREAFKGFMAQVKAITPEKRVLMASAYGIRNPEGRELSPYNQCLLIHQLPTVSIVGGFAQWAKLDRSVRKGEKALSIWVRTGSSKAEAADDAEPADTESARSNFIIGTVFDISQTETALERDERRAPRTIDAEQGQYALAI
jgi:hypothetical protein